MILLCSLLAIALTSTSVSCEALIKYARPETLDTGARRRSSSSASRLLPAPGSNGGLQDEPVQYQSHHSSGPDSYVQPAAEADDSGRFVGSSETDADLSAETRSVIELLNNLLDKYDRLRKQQETGAASAPNGNSKRAFYWVRDSSRWRGLRSLQNHRPDPNAGAETADGDLQPQNRPKSGYSSKGRLFWGPAHDHKREKVDGAVPCDVINRISKWVLRNCGYSRIVKRCESNSASSSGTVQYFRNSIANVISTVHRKLELP